MTMTSHSPAPAPAIGDPALDAADILDLSERLTVLLTQETALLKAMRVSDIEPLQAEKLRLTRLYQKAVLSLRGDGTARPALPDPLKSQLAAAGQRLADVTAENERSLRVSHAATECLIAAIITAIKDQRPSTSGYTSRMAAPRSDRVSGVALDRRM